MMNEEGPAVGALRKRPVKPLPRNVTDDIVEVLTVNLANANFDEGTAASGAQFTVKIQDTMVTGVTVDPVAVAPGPLKSPSIGSISYPSTIGTRQYISRYKKQDGSYGELNLVVEGPGGTFDSGVSEKDIKGDLDDLLAVHAATLFSLTGDGTSLTATITVKPKGATYGSADATKMYGGSVPAGLRESKRMRRN